MQVLLLSVAIGFIFLSGCAALSYGTYSRVEGSEHTILRKATRDWAGVQRPDVIDFDDFRLIIKPHNWHTSINIWGPYLPFLPLPGGCNESEEYSKAQQRGFFLVTVIVEPKAQGLHFDPFAVILQSSTKDRTKPKGFWVDRPNALACFGYTSNTVKQPPQEFIAGIEPVPIAAKTCFTLLFDMPALDSDDSFVFEIMGMTKMAQPIPIKPLPFIRHSGWDYSIVPL